MSFSDWNLPSFLEDKIVEMGWENPTPIQSIAIPKALEGFDILGSAPTGTGKSAAFLIPIIARLCLEKKDGVRALILEPTRELAIQVCNVAKELCEYIEDFEVSTIIGGEGRDIQKESNPTIVVATPGRLLEFLKKEWLSTNDIEIVVIDEADRMLDMGFRDDVASIIRETQNRYQTMLFSATLEGFGVRDFADAVLNTPIEIRLGSGDEDEKLPDGLSQRAYYTCDDSQKQKVLVHLLRTTNFKSIIFVKTKERVLIVSALLKKNGFSFATLQGEQSHTERQAAFKRFANNDVNILVATDLAARGLDVSDISHVYNYDIASSAAIYVHRAGRTARAGQKGTVITFARREDIATLNSIERYTGASIEKRQIKNVCAAFPLDEATKGSITRVGRATIGGKGGFDKKKKDTEKPRVKKRQRVLKNKGKPDFAAKRAKKKARELENQQQS